MKKVDLVSYLPQFMRDFKEITVALEAENPEFILLWKAKERVFLNEFIETADEYGISRFEKILNILPLKEDTLESRRSRVQARWFSSIPYTLPKLKELLSILCDNNDFKIDILDYKLTVKVALKSKGMFDEVGKMLERMVPLNMIIDLDLMYNQHLTVGRFRHCDLHQFTHKQLRDEVLK